MYSLFLDLVIAGLLAVTITYAVMLNRKLTGLRRDRAELERLTASFGEATLRAGQSTQRLKGTADSLQESMTKAQGLRDDLQFLIERAGQAADRLEAAVRGSRDLQGREAPRVAPEPAPASLAERRVERPAPAKPRLTSVAATAPAEQAARPRSEAERQLLKVLRAVRG